MAGIFGENGGEIGLVYLVGTRLIAHQQDKCQGEKTACEKKSQRMDAFFSLPLNERDAWTSLGKNSRKKF